MRKYLINIFLQDQEEARLVHGFQNSLPKFPQKFLKQKEAKLKKKFDGFSVPRPSYWCGIKIMPKEFEFWQQGDYRLHDREVYKLKKNNWTRKILSP